jgi:tartrate dehydrogenase/decarboxylase/D-malate dehydrogenase
MGIAAGANINPEKEFPSMFEPVHGSAPDIAGKNRANPIACFWTAVMMLEHLGENEAAGLLMNAIEKVIEKGRVLTADLGGRSSTREVTQAVVDNIIKN